MRPFVGTVNVTIADNEGEFFETAPGGNAFLIRFVGTVTDTETGQRYHLQGAIHIVVLPDGTFTFQPVPPTDTYWGMIERQFGHQYHTRA